MPKWRLNPGVISFATLGASVGAIAVQPMHPFHLWKLVVAIVAGGVLGVAICGFLPRRPGSNF